MKKKSKRFHVSHASITVSHVSFLFRGKNRVYVCVCRAYYYYIDNVFFKWARQRASVRDVEHFAILFLYFLTFNLRLIVCDFSDEIMFISRPTISSTKKKTIRILYGNKE